MLSPPQYQEAPSNGTGDIWLRRQGDVPTAMT